MGKAIVAQAYKGILHNNENKQATGTSNNMDASHRYMIKWKKNTKRLSERSQTQNNTQCIVHLYEDQKQAKLTYSDGSQNSCCPF